MASRVISVRLRDAESEKLDRYALRFGRSRGETASLLLREKLREEEFPGIGFRNSPIGRQAHLEGHRLSVWMLVVVARDFEMNAKHVAKHLELPVHLIEAGLAYATTYRDEIDQLVHHFDSITVEDLKRTLPSLIVFDA